MKFSVIIPVYKAETTIERCLDSLLNQPHGDVEIIIVNDGSPDNCGAICRCYADEHECVRYFEKENGGVSSARNLGLKMADGEYILFVDSDDYVSPDYFEVLRNRIIQKDDLILFSYNRILANCVKPILNDQLAWRTKSAFEKINYIVYERKGSPCNKCYKRDIIQKGHISFPEDLYVGEDFIFGLNYMLSCKTVTITDDLLYFVDESNSDSLTRKIRRDRYLQALRIYEYAFDFVQKCGWDEAQRNELLRTLDYIYCRTAFASIKYELHGKSRNYIKCRSIVKRILLAFKRERTEWYKPKSVVHRIMRITIKREMDLIAFLVAIK